MICIRCGESFKPTAINQKLCVPCKPKHKYETERIRHLERKAGTRIACSKKYECADILEISNYKPKPRPLLISDDEQRVIDRSWELKENFKFQAKIYRQSDADWDALCARVTPLHKIRIGFSDDRVKLTAPMVDGPRKRYTSQVDL